MELPSETSLELTRVISGVAHRQAWTKKGTRLGWFSLDNSLNSPSHRCLWFSQFWWFPREILLRSLSFWKVFIIHHWVSSSYLQVHAAAMCCGASATCNSELENKKAWEENVQAILLLLWKTDTWGIFNCGLYGFKSRNKQCTYYKLQLIRSAIKKVKI